MKSVNYVTFDEESGAIISSGSCLDSNISLQTMGEPGTLALECGEGVSDISHFVEGGIIQEREQIALSTHIVGLLVTINGLPEGSEVRVSGLSVTSDGGPTDIEFDAPGRHDVDVSPPPRYKDESLEVTVG